MSREKHTNVWLLHEESGRADILPHSARWQRSPGSHTHTWTEYFSGLQWAQVLLSCAIHWPWAIEDRPRGHSGHVSSQSGYATLSHTFTVMNKNKDDVHFTIHAKQGWPFPNRGFRPDDVFFHSAPCIRNEYNFSIFRPSNFLHHCWFLFWSWPRDIPRGFESISVLFRSHTILSKVKMSFYCVSTWSIPLEIKREICGVNSFS